jgi:NhaA family Na+:H+ antiporter
VTSAPKRGPAALLTDSALAARLRLLFPGEALGGAALIACAVVALAWANSPWASVYFGLLHTEVPVRVGGFHLELSLLHWINDLVMAVFFLVVGLEIKRELLAGELAEPRRAALPVAGALGGMLVPALIYAALNAGGAAARGWGIPMATDIAFSLGVLALLGERVPRGLTVFLTALAIVDDLGAVAVIAIFYTAQLDLGALAIAGVIGAFLLALGLRGVRRLAPYLVLAPFLWLFMFRSGVHATIAGVVLGIAVPLGVVGARAGDRSPLERLEHALKPWVTWGVMPLFAFANAGVSLAGMTPRSLAEPAAIGVALGLFVGKPVGIFLLSWISVRLKLASLPRGASWRQVWGVGMIAGIGFTVALFVASLSFHPGDGLEDRAKIGVLIGSLLSGVLGTFALGVALGRKTAKPAALEGPPARASD